VYFKTCLKGAGKVILFAMETYKTTIGLEVHAELKTKTKMFCNSANAPHKGEVNSHICPVCMAHPGTLPVINKEAVKSVLKVGIALNSKLATYTEFDRKNYFYPDIPKSYQISQYLYPLVSKGSLNGIDITRVHLEEDTARSLHDKGEGSIIDYNRAGVPLMELVTEPVLHDSKSAGNFARELQLLLKTLNVSDANMEKGEMRVEANVSVSKTDKLGTKVEVKNINSFKAVEGAIEYEIKRQIARLEKGENVIQETRGWDENRDKTFSQRLKETSEEYRYFPDPDLPSLNLTEIEEFQVSRLKEEMPDTPEIKRLKYDNLGITRDQIEVIISNKELDSFFELTYKYIEKDTKLAKNVSNYLTTDILKLVSENNTLVDSDISHFIKLMQMVSDNKITSRVAKDLLKETLFDGLDAEIVAEERGLLQDSSEDILLPIVAKIIADNKSIVSEYKTGKESVLQFLVGKGMKETKGSANPIVLANLLKKKMKE